MTAPIIENNYTGDGSTVLFSFTFEYIEATDIEVSIDNVTLATTAYSLANSTTVEFVTAPASGAAIRIYRNTTVNDPKATFFPGSAIRAQDLNDNFEQILFVTQEADAISERAELAADAAQTATTNAQAAADSATTAANTAQAAVTSAQASAAAAAADAAQATADAAQAAADSAEAVAAVAAAYLFSEIANVSAIPSNPSNNDAVRVVDSTNIETTSTVQGLPTGFVGDSGIFVEILYSSSAQKWNFVNYNANDPDDRYGYPPYVDITRQNTVDAAALSGVALNSTNLGTFTGSTITDNTTVKAALQELETEVETKVDSVNGQTGAVTLTASNVSALPISGGTLTGDITFNNSQVFPGLVTFTTSTGSAELPVGTTAQRDASPAAGMIRYNSTLGQFEGYSTAWGAIGGGATGGGSDGWALEHDNTITTSYTIGTGKNVISAGPLTVNSGATVTVPSGSNWTIV